MTAEGKTLWVQSGYGFNTRRPFVTITMPGGESVQMEVEEAREHAAAIYAAAEAAVQDGWLFEWAGANLSGDKDRNGALLVAELRKWREAKKL